MKILPSWSKCFPKTPPANIIPIEGKDCNISTLEDINIQIMEERKNLKQVIMIALAIHGLSCYILAIPTI